MLPVFNGGTDELTYVGSGHHRLVYVHPFDDSKCVKILRAGHADALSGRQRRLLAQREHDYYNFLSRRGVAGGHIAGYYGRMRIQSGDDVRLAGIFDLIRNEDGQVSKTLDAELAAATDFEELTGAMCELYGYLLRHKIISGFKMPNIVVQRAQRAPAKCVLIDNIGNTDFIPICNYIDWLATAKIRRRWMVFLKKNLTKYNENPIIRQTLRKVLQSAYRPD